MKIPGSIPVLASLLLCAAFLAGCGGGSVGTPIPQPTNTTTTLTSSAASVPSGTAITLTATVSPSAATGTVTFLDGSTTLGTGTLSAGVATFSTTTLGIGTHAITASYSGAGSAYNGSTSTPLSIAVTTLATTTTLSASTATAAVGTAVTFTAMVSPSAATGTVTFYDGATALGMGTLASGVATFSTTTLALGAHTVTAVYGSATPYAGSTSAASTITMTSIATTTVLTSSASTATAASPVTLTATVSPSAATGMVTFYDGVTALGISTLSNGVATFPVSALVIGSHSLTAKYAGAGNYGGSTSNAVTVTGTAAATTIGLVSSTASAFAGATVTFTATVASSAATGTVTFYDGATSLGTGTLASGTATLALSTLSVGSHSITAVYGGDTNYATSTSSAVPVTITINTTTLALIANTTTAVTGTNVTFTANATPTSTPGSITFMDGGVTLGSGVLSAGVATLTLSSLTAGVHFVAATYAGNANYAAQTSNAITVTISKASSPPLTGTYSGPSITGKVLAGGSPVTGASVQFYAAGTTGNGIAAGNLMVSAILTDSSGSFTIPSGYSCPLPTTQVYLVATGGTTASAANAPFEFLTALGSCNAVPMTITLNEVTTAAAAWPLARFLASGGQIGATATNTIGLANAFLIANSLVNTTTGASPGTSYPANASSVKERINSLANLLNTCAASNAACLQLFSTTGASPTNTLDAAMLIVQHPAANPGPLYTLSRNSTAYTPALTTAPADWTLFSVLSGGGLSSPSMLGMMTNGSVWVANYFGGVASQFTVLGAPAFPNGVPGPGLSASYGLAVDQANNAWIPNDVSGGSVTKISADGATTANFSGSGMNFPVYTAVDTDASVWVADYGNSTLTHLSSTGAPLSGPSGYQSASTQFPTVLAIDANHNVWTNDQSGYTITRIAPDGTNPLVVTCCNSPVGLAIDQRGNIWAANFLGNSVSEVSSTGTVISSGYTGGGIFRPQAVAVDGVGNVWVVNFYAIGISELAGSQSSTPGAVLSPSSGFAPDGPIAGNFSITVDASGNVWVTNFNSNNVIRYFGLAAPAKMPAIGPAQAP